MWINFQGYHTIFFYSKTHQIFYLSLFEIILIIVKGTSLYVFQSEWTQLHFHFIMNAIFSYLVFTYFLNIFQVFFFHFFCKGILSLSFINYRFIYISMFTQARQTSQLTVLSLKNENIIIGIVWSWGIGLLCIAFQVN